MSLTIYTGPMFSGKSSFLVHRAQNASRVQKVLYINHSFDNRNKNGDIISVHNEFLNVKGNFDVISACDLSDISDALYLKYDVICIDECQFFPNLVERLKHLVDELGLVILVAGLNGTSERKPFSNSEFLELFCIADDVVFLKDAWCEMCKKQKGIFTFKNSQDTQEIVIGSEDVYMPLCRKCYITRKSILN
jgi:thymidine kinase